MKVADSELTGCNITSPRCLFLALPPAGLESTIAKHFDSADRFMTSHVDEQLLLFTKFRRAVNIHSIQLTSLSHSDEGAKRPRMVKLFTNTSHPISWDEAEDEPGVQTITINEKDWDEETGTAVLKLHYVKFKRVYDVVLFVSSNQGDAFTRLDRVRIIGNVAM